MATEKIGQLNTIYALSFHIQYYIKGVMNAFKTGELTIKDTYSYDAPKLTTENEWDDFKTNLWIDVKAFSSLIADLDMDTLMSTFIEEKYSTYFHNITGIIEHTYYHLGQIVFIKKLLSAK